MNLNKNSNIEQNFAALNTLLYHKLLPAIPVYPCSAISSFFIRGQCKIRSSICCLANEWLQWYTLQLSNSTAPSTALYTLLNPLQQPLTWRLTTVVHVTIWDNVRVCDNSDLPYNNNSRDLCRIEFLNSMTSRMNYYTMTQHDYEVVGPT